MATHKSAIKRNRQNARRQLINQMRRTRIKTLTRDVIAAADSGDGDAARDALGKAVPVIQRAASQGTLHRNTASRKISRLSRRVNSLGKDNDTAVSREKLDNVPEDSPENSSDK